MFDQAFRYRDAVAAGIFFRLLAFAGFLGIALMGRWPSGLKRFSGRIFVVYCAAATVVGLVEGIWYLTASGLFGLAMNVPVVVYEIRHGVEAPDLRKMYRQHRERK